MVKVRKKKDIEGILKEGERALKEELEGAILTMEYTYRLSEKDLSKDSILQGVFTVYLKKYRNLCRLGINTKSTISQMDAGREKGWTPYSEVIRGLGKQYLKKLREERKGRS